MERFEVFDRLRGDVRRPVPGCEALEPAGPGNAIEARLVRLRGGGRPPYPRAWGGSVVGGLLVRGEIADRVKPWTVELLLPAGERLPEGVEVGVCSECSNVSVYAALHAAGCPRLAFLLTDLDPRDPLDEVVASWKLWLVRAAKRARRVAEPIEVVARCYRGEISAETRAFNFFPSHCFAHLEKLSESGVVQLVTFNSFPVAAGRVPERRASQTGHPFNSFPVAA